jgi:hypothetical protein
MRGGERQAFGLCPVEPRGAGPARFVRIVFARRAEARIVELEGEVQEVAGEQHALCTAIEKHAPMSWRVTRRVSEIQAGRHRTVSVDVSSWPVASNGAMTSANSRRSSSSVNERTHSTSAP